MSLGSYTKIENVRDLYNKASSLRDRAHRMSPGQNGGSRVDPKVIACLAKAAEEFEVINRESYAASGVVFLQKEQEFVSGQRVLEVEAANTALGYIANQVQKKLRL